MNKDSFKSVRAGKVIRTPKDYWAFIPNRLPPEIQYTKKLVASLSESDRHLGNLNGIGNLLPNPTLLIIPYVRREAVLSSRIEGTQTSLSELFYFEASRKEEQKKEAQKTDVIEVLNYVKALDHGLKRLKTLPLSLRLIKEMHVILMKGVRGQHLTPGEFRKSQNWIGSAGCTLNDAAFVPPPVENMKAALSDLEEFLHDRDALAGLIQCAMVHYQFEAIHPFLDGNGRIGRLLVSLFLCEREHIKYPLLYLSAFLEKYRDEYYARLIEVSQKGKWEEWIMFFLKAVSVESQDAIANSKSILALLDNYRKLIGQKKASPYVYKLLDEIFKNPYITIPGAANKLKTSFHTAKAAIEKLQSLNVLKEVTHKDRGKIYCAGELLNLLEPK